MAKHRGHKAALCLTINPGVVKGRLPLKLYSGSDGMHVRTDENLKVFVPCGFCRPGANARGKTRKNSKKRPSAAFLTLSGRHKAALCLTINPGVVKGRLPFSSYHMAFFCASNPPLSSLLSISVMNICPGLWVITRGGFAFSMAACGVTPHGQNTHTSPLRMSTGAP